MRLIFAAFKFLNSYGFLPLVKHVLETYIAVRKDVDKFSADLDDVLKVGGTMFLDSGAFSAWTKGESIDIDAYARFCVRLQDKVEAIANLDVIPGEYGRTPTDAEVRASAEVGWNNYQYLLDNASYALVQLLIHLKF